MTPALAAAEVADYTLGLDRIGLGTPAARIRLRTLQLDVRPVLLRQSELLKASLRAVDLDPGRAGELARQAASLDAEIVSAWQRCHEQLKVLYLTSEPSLAEVPT